MYDLKSLLTVICYMLTDKKIHNERYLRSEVCYKKEDLRKLQRDDGFDFTIVILIRVKCNIISENRINFY